MNTNVMLVDDEEFIRDAVEFFFKTKGVNVITASGGDECLRHLEDGFKGVILMDVMMPRMDGWDTIREMVKRDLFRGNFIIMLTAKDEPDNKMDGLQEFIADYITKPFEPHELHNTVAYYSALLTEGSLDNV